MADVTEILTKAKDVISLVKNEYEKLQEIESLKMKYLPIYINIIDAMDNIVKELDRVENSNYSDKVKDDIIEILNLSLWFWNVNPGGKSPSLWNWAIIDFAGNITLKSFAYFSNISSTLQNHKKSLSQNSAQPL